tara:strand:- start:156 stop:1019 length:864 start_codon:yes stop_codon:yes gene_type:complete
MGGAGKTPTVEYIVDHMTSKSKRIAIISRGYKRKTKGMIVATSKDTYLTIGDEPSQYNKKFSSKAIIIVSEDRNLALKYCDENNVEYAIMDDGFQNLTFEKDLNILVSSFEKPFFYDDRFPMGMLRESKNNAFRADLLVYSNTPKNISDQKLKRFKTKSEYYLRPETPILYSFIKYNRPIKIFGSRLKKDVIVVSSIAYPEKFYEYIKSKYNVIEIIKFKDHYNFSADDLRGISKKLSDNISLITTEKDAVKLCEFPDILSPYTVYYVPISTEYLFDNKLSDYLERL